MRVVYLASTSIGAIFLAFYLRFFHGLWLREYVTRELGFVARAAVEHLFAAFGMGLFMMVLFACAVALEPRPSLQLEATKKPKVRLDLNNPEHLYFALWLGMCLGVGYFAFSLLYEIDQAYFNAFMKLPPHGYVQWEQVSADFIGVLLGIQLTWNVISPVASKGKLFPGPTQFDAHC